MKKDSFVVFVDLQAPSAEGIAAIHGSGPFRLMDNPASCTCGAPVTVVHPCSPTCEGPEGEICTCGGLKLAREHTDDCDKRYRTIWLSGTSKRVRRADIKPYVVKAQKKSVEAPKPRPQVPAFL